MLQADGSYARAEVARRRAAAPQPDGTARPLARARRDAGRLTPRRRLAFDAFDSLAETNGAPERDKKKKQGQARKEGARPPSGSDPDRDARGLRRRVASAGATSAASPRHGNIARPIPPLPPPRECTRRSARSSGRRSDRTRACLSPRTKPRQRSFTRCQAVSRRILP